LPVVEAMAACILPSGASGVSTTTTPPWVTMKADCAKPQMTTYSFSTARCRRGLGLGQRLRRERGELGRHRYPPSCDRQRFLTEAEVSWSLSRQSNFVTSHLFVT